MDELHLWFVTYEIHTYDDRFIVEGMKTQSDCIGNAIKDIDMILADGLEAHNWSDYNIISATIVPNIH